MSDWPVRLLVAVIVCGLVVWGISAYLWLVPILGVALNIAGSALVGLPLWELIWRATMGRDETPVSPALARRRCPASGLPITLNGDAGPDSLSCAGCDCPGYDPADPRIGVCR
jgi:hypothetical protein